MVPLSLFGRQKGKKAVRPVDTNARRALWAPGLQKRASWLLTAAHILVGANVPMRQLSDLAGISAFWQDAATCLLQHMADLAGARAQDERLFPSAAKSRTRSETAPGSG